MELEPPVKTTALVWAPAGVEAVLDVVVALEGAFPAAAEEGFVDAVAGPAAADWVEAEFEPDSGQVVAVTVSTLSAVTVDELVELPDGRVMFPIGGPHDPVIILCALTPPVVPSLVTSISSQKSGRRIC